MRHRHHHRRRYQHVRVIIPSSTPQSLVFPYDLVNKKFNVAHQTGKVTKEEIEEFLKEVNVPIKAFYDDHPPKSPGGMGCLCILFLILFPLLPFFICYMVHKGNKMDKEMNKAVDRAATIVKSRGSTFTERGMVWSMGAHFPRWIELWTSVGADGQPVAQQATQPNMLYNQQLYQGQPGIEMQSVPQQDYQNTFGVNNQV